MTRRSAWLVTLALSLGAGGAVAQEPIEHGTLEERETRTVAFRFHPEVGEGWRERTVVATRVSWEVAIGDSSVTDTTERELRWRVSGRNRDGYRVELTTGPWRQVRDGREQPSALGALLGATSFHLEVDGDGVAEAARAAASPRLDSLLATVAHADLGFEPGREQLEAFVADLWNARAAAFAGQEWEQAESAFDESTIELPGLGEETLYAELWFEEPAEARGRAAARLEARFFTGAADTAALDPEAFEAFREDTGAGLFADETALTDFLAAGRATWFVDPERSVILEGQDEVRGLVVRWSPDGVAPALTGTLTRVVLREAVPLPKPGSTSKR